RYDLVRGRTGDSEATGRYLLTRREWPPPGIRKHEKFQEDPHWRDLILFYEYFHGDNGAGLGASHQTGWTYTIALLIDIFGRFDAPRVLETLRTNGDSLHQRTGGRRRRCRD